jgi:hypothetical protein
LSGSRRRAELEEEALSRWRAAAERSGGALSWEPSPGQQGGGALVIAGDETQPRLVYPAQMGEGGATVDLAGGVTRRVWVAIGGSGGGGAANGAAAAPAMRKAFSGRVFGGDGSAGRQQRGPSWLGGWDVDVVAIVKVFNKPVKAF